MVVQVRVLTVIQRVKTGMSGVTNLCAQAIMSRRVQRAQIRETTHTKQSKGKTPEAETRGSVI